MSRRSPDAIMVLSLCDLRSKPGHCLVKGRATSYYARTLDINQNCPGQMRTCSLSVKEPNLSQQGGYMERMRQEHRGHSLRPQLLLCWPWVWSSSSEPQLLPRPVSVSVDCVPPPAQCHQDLPPGQIPTSRLICRVALGLDFDSGFQQARPSLRVTENPIEEKRGAPAAPPLGRGP